MEELLLVRADAGAAIGSGHVMRCLALAQAWQDAGGSALRASATESPVADARYEGEGIATIRISAEPGSAADAGQTVALARERAAAWVVVDGYRFGADYQKAVKDAGLRQLYVDDYGQADHYFADVVLNQNPYADASVYASRERHTELLLGLRYALLRREFYSRVGFDRQIPSAARRLLVTMGGGETGSVIDKVLDALRMLGNKDLEAVVLVGGRQVADAQAGRLAFPVRFERDVADMPGLMAWADLAISGAGSTCWELAFMGLPAMLVVLAENQRPVAESVQQAGAGVNLGEQEAVTAESIARAVEELLPAGERRLAMSQAGRGLVDGRGAERVVRHMKAAMLSLRPVREDDCRLIWQWANEPELRAMSFLSEAIPWEDHVKWFRSKLADRNCIFRVAELAGQPVGQVRFDCEANRATISIGLDKAFRGRGLGSQLIRLASRELFGKTDATVIHAYIKPENAASVGAFTGAGFSHRRETDRKGQKAILLLLHRDEMA